MNKEALLKYNKVTKETIDKWIRDEFGIFYDKFSIKIYRYSEIESSIHDVMPGAYIFFYQDVIWKIGKHQKDVLKRCKEHIRDNSGEYQNKLWEMKQIADIPDCECIIYKLNNISDKHWLHALESFLESKARDENVLLIRSGRIG